MLRRLVILSAILAVATPIAIHINNVSWHDSPLTASLFPIFGLLAFTLLWLHAVSGLFSNRWLHEQFDFDAFVHWTSLVIFVCIIIHPLLLLILIKFDFKILFSGDHTPIILGLIGLTLLLTYDLGKWLRKHNPFFIQHWHKILIVSNIGFVIIFFHSLKIGSDLQSGFMHWLWIFYGVTAIIALIYTYGVKKFLKK